ncbi:hypothetical protein PHLCEN_2v5971 [Hermanssonia centrifuga]|uniref:Uncharacterized protein n=1 Tax=Hermanssonia centrifuga TaxID=98765 RepID=A0A2R6P0S7_9APHY|nr:hypothetical protein PHLCEN_2v5971 [Hermanssonia centrifuga]
MATHTRTVHRKMYTELRLLKAGWVTLVVNPCLSAWKSKIITRLVLFYGDGWGGFIATSTINPANWTPSLLLGLHPSSTSPPMQLSPEFLVRVTSTRSRSFSSQKANKNPLVTG